MAFRYSYSPRNLWAIWNRGRRQKWRTLDQGANPDRALWAGRWNLMRRHVRVILNSYTPVDEKDHVTNFNPVTWTIRLWLDVHVPWILSKNMGKDLV